jgi:hypothetical protein
MERMTTRVGALLVVTSRAGDGWHTAVVPDDGLRDIVPSGTEDEALRTHSRVVRRLVADE